MEYAIEVKNLTKNYGEIIAVNNINFEVKEGEIFGFLGPNGAGKTTTIRMLTGLSRPTSGTARVLARALSFGVQEHVPNRSEMYRIIDATNNFRDRAMFLVLFQSGIRVNALCSLRFKDVKNQLYQEEAPKIPLRLRITDKIDTKLRGYSIDFYDTFLQGETVEALKAYCDKVHRDGKEDEPLFYTKLGRAMNATAVWETLKRSVRRAGLNPATIWVHTIRRAFKRGVSHASVDDEDFKEAIMGHVLPGSRENYFSRNDPQEIQAEYMKIDFGREIPETKVQKQAKEIERLKQRLTKLEPQDEKERKRMMLREKFLDKLVERLGVDESKWEQFGKFLETL